jgi:hypothetical protein
MDEAEAGTVSDATSAKVQNRVFFIGVCLRIILFFGSTGVPVPVIRGRWRLVTIQE